VIDPIQALAFSLQANPGMYAVLLGSGVSRSAQIPTGWEITLELINKIAHLRGVACAPTPETWYRDSFGREPDYSELLDMLARTPSERQQLLQGYFEANASEREEGLKQPTKAHRAIASLIEGGYIRVVITTNFDRLLEQALAEIGITPTVISSVDHIRGALPLIHTRCSIIKVHGDYKDTRILNSPKELAAYPDEMNLYLDRVFDEFGLIVCGWSAEWDEALRHAITRAPNRRFSTYWMARSEPCSFAQDLIQHRAAQVIETDGADEFFENLFEQVQSLEEYSRPHPLGTNAMVTSLKRYLAEDKHRIQLSDLIGAEVERVLKATRGPNFDAQRVPPPDTTSFTMRVKRYEAACTTLLAMSVVGGYWAETKHFDLWGVALERLSTVPVEGGNIVWLDLRRYPATLFLYGLGIAAVQKDNLDLLGFLFGRSIRTVNRERSTLAQLLPPFSLFEAGGHVARLLPEKERAHAPLNDWLFELLRPFFQSLIQDDEAFQFAFDKFEILLSLAYTHATRAGNCWTPPGCFGYRRGNLTHVFRGIQDSISTQEAASPYVKCGIFGDTAEECLSSMELFKKNISHLHW
jgi:hypothetical protein